MDVNILKNIIGYVASNAEDIFIEVNSSQLIKNQVIHAGCR